MDFVAPTYVKKNSHEKFFKSKKICWLPNKKSSKSPAFRKPQDVNEDIDDVLQKKYNS